MTLNPWFLTKIDKAANKTKVLAHNLKIVRPYKVVFAWWTMNVILKVIVLYCLDLYCLSICFQGCHFNWLFICINYHNFIFRNPIIFHSLFFLLFYSLFSKKMIWYIFCQFSEIRFIEAFCSVKYMFNSGWFYTKWEIMRHKHSYYVDHTIL